MSDNKQQSGKLPLSTSGMSPLDVAMEAARQGGTVLMEHFHHAQLVRRKGKGNITTDADMLSEKTILMLLRREYPSHNIIAEESGNSASDSPFTWTVDPLDGTNNFMFGYPFFCCTVGFIAGGNVVAGATYDPIRKEMFSAQVGKGAFLNGISIAVSPRGSLEKSLVAADLGYDQQGGLNTLDVCRVLWRRVHSVRIVGSAALELAYVACGRADLYLHQCLYPWDIAGGILLVREAGGTVTDWEGSPADYTTHKIVAGSGAVHKEFMATYAGIAKSLPVQMPD